MSAAIAIVAVLLVVAAVVAVVLVRRRPGTSPESAVDPGAESVSRPTREPRPEPEPMTGLESALAAVTDHEGRPMQERIDAEADHVDDLRVPDDTGPLLRRALDHVEHAPDGDAADPANAADNDPG